MRVPRTVLAILTALPLLATSAVVGTAAPAQAASGGCRIGLSGLPSKVTIDATDRRYWVKATSSNCPWLDKDLSWVNADAYGPNTTRKRTYSMIWVDDFVSSERITLDSSYFAAGKYTVLDVDSSIIDRNYNDRHYTWVTKTFVAKYRGWNTLAVKRSGKTVKINGHVRRYSPSAWDYVGSRNKVTIQRYDRGAWRAVKTVTPKAGGAFAISFKNAKRYSYRAKTVETGTVLGSISTKRVG